MPLYEFECCSCGFVFEKTQRMDDPNPRCPKYIRYGTDEDGRVIDGCCGGETKKLISHSSFVLKGGGWASDGYGGGSK